MTLLIAILSMLVCVLLLLLFLHSHEIRDLARQLRMLREQDTNQQLHSRNGTADALINEINLLLKELHKQQADYQQRVHALDQMLTNLSHDLRTPLTSAMGYVSILRNCELPREEIEQELTIVENRLSRLEELIDSFFEFSKVISSEKKPEMTELNLIAVLEESIVHYYDDFTSQGRQITLRCDTHRLMLLSNRELLLRIFDNLIGNAWKHSSGDLLVTVELADGLALHFQNNAAQPIDTVHIFDEFYTTDISRTKGNTGLGLAIARQFTELLGGQISATQDNKVLCLTIRWDL